MTGAGESASDEAGMSSRLTAGLRALADSGFAVPAAEVADRESAERPLPPLTSHTSGTSRREPTAEGLAMADRILVAAGAGSGVPERHTGTMSDSSDDPSRTAMPVEGTVGGGDHSGQTTLAPSAAVVAFPSGEQHVVREGETLTIGRVAAEGVIAVNHVEVSRRHVTLEMRFGQLIATDLGSTNGTVHVSAHLSSRLSPQTPTHLLEGDRLQVGPDVPLCVVERIEWQA